MTKWVEVPVTISKVFAVEIEDSESAEDAIKVVLDELAGDNVEIDHKDVLIAESEAMEDSIKRHADERITL